jgi:hypothetical protein
VAMKQLTYFVLLALVLSIGFTPAYALEKEAGATASLSATFGSITREDVRTTQLANYLEAVNSPMAGSAKQFISEADRLNLDWRLVAAIAGVESYFGQHIPKNSYNAWGWAIFTGKSDGRHFGGWGDGITQVSEGLQTNYVNRGRDTVWTMGPVYAADPTWAWKVNHFMEEIASYQPRSTSELAIAL